MAERITWSPAQILQDPEFLAAPESTQLEVMRAADADFSAAGLQEQRAVLQAARRQYAPTTGERVQSGLETFLPPVTATVGAGIGAGFGVVGSIPGAVIGAMGGTGITELTRPYLTDQGPRPLIGDPRLGPSGLGILERQAMAGVEGGAGEIGARLGTRAVERTLSPFASRQIPEMMKVQQQLQGVGKTLTAGQMLDSALVRNVESAVEASLGGARLKSIKEGVQKEGVQALTDKLIADVGTTQGPTGLSQLLMKARETSVEFDHAIRKVMYRQVDDLARGTVVDTTPIIAAFDKPQMRRGLDKVTALTDAGMDVKLEDLLRPHITVGPSGNRVTGPSFSEATEARSRLLRVARRFEGEGRTADDAALSAEAKRLAGLVDRQIEASASRLNPEALAKWRETNALTRESAERYHGDLVRKVVRRLEDEPGKLEDVLFQHNSVDTWKAVRGALPVATMNQIEQRMVVKLVNSSVNEEGIVQGATMLRQLQNLGDETVTAMFPQTAGRLQDFARTIHRIQHAGSSEFGKVAMQLSQAGAAIQVLAQPVSGKAATATSYTLLIAPAVLSRILGKPEGIKTLTEGFRAGFKTETSLRLLGQLASQYGGEQAARQFGGFRSLGTPEGRETVSIPPMEGALVR